MGGYVHSMQTPLYFASKAAIVSMVKSLGGLKNLFGIRNAAVCPGAVGVSCFHTSSIPPLLPQKLSLTNPSRRPSSTPNTAEIVAGRTASR